MKTTLLLLLSLSFAPVAFSQDSTTHQDFDVEDPAYDQQLWNDIQLKLSELTEAEPDLSTVHIPDYKYVYKILQAHIASGFSNYLLKLSIMTKEVRQFLRDLNAIEQAGDPRVSSLMELELKKRVPKLNADLNFYYKDAIQQLYFLGNDNLVIVFGDHENPKNQLQQKIKNIKGQFHISEKELKILKLCRTVACVQKITDDIRQYYEFIEGLNQTLQLSNFKTRKFFDWGDRPYHPLVSTAIKRATEKLVEGFRANEEYDLGTTLGAIFKAPGSAFTAIAIGPMYVFENLFIALDNFFSFRHIKLELKLEKLPSYSTKAMIEQMVYSSKDLINERPTLIFDAQEAAKISAELESQLEKELKTIQSK